jgi:hypothetical protein
VAPKTKKVLQGRTMMKKMKKLETWMLLISISKPGKANHLIRVILKAFIILVGLELTRENHMIFHRLMLVRLHNLIREAQGR